MKKNHKLNEWKILTQPMEDMTFRCFNDIFLYVQIRLVISIFADYDNKVNQVLVAVKDFNLFCLTKYIFYKRLAKVLLNMSNIN
uniref:Uncharacterized protein n=1 Tax=Strongyloides papillosus TaxID=174720 RepID=A0A0N5BWN5_STREA